MAYWCEEYLGLHFDLTIYSYVTLKKQKQNLPKLKLNFYNQKPGILHREGL